MVNKDRKRSKNYSPQTEVGQKQEKTKCVNFFAGAGARKSTMATILHGMLKMHGITSEYTAEFAKDLAWEGRLELPINDMYVFGQQHNRQFILNGKVDCIISDSPLLLSSVYRSNDSLMDALVMQEFNKYENINFYMVRPKEYNRKGRKENKAEATKIDQKTKSMLDYKQIPYYTIKGDLEGINFVLQIILKRLNTKQEYVIRKI